MNVEILAPDTLEVNIHGKLKKEDYANFVPLAEERIERHDKINLLLRIHEFRGWEPAALWEDIKFDVSHYSDVERLAIVGEDQSKKWMATVSKPLTSAEVKYFPASELESARQWVRSGVRNA